MNLDEYSGGWVPRMTEDGCEWEQFGRVRVRPGKWGSDVVEVFTVCDEGHEAWVRLFMGEVLAHGLEVARIQRDGPGANDPPRVRSLLSLDGYFAESEKYETREEIGRVAAFVQKVWDRINGR